MESSTPRGGEKKEWSWKRGERESWRGCVSTLPRVRESERGGRRRERKRGREKRGGREVEELSPRRAHAARGAAGSDGSFARSRCLIFRVGGGRGRGARVAER